MVSQKIIRRDARSLYKLTLDAQGRIDPQRLTAILAALEANQPPGYLPLLRAYQRLVAAEVARGEARIEHAGPLTQDQADRIAAAFSKKLGRPLTTVTRLNPDLIAGIRVRIADDIHDLSAAGTLAEIAAAAA